MDKWEVLPRMYKDIVETIQDNTPNIQFIDAKNTVRITKKDMMFEVTHPDELKEIMELMWKVNNFICRQYRTRKHILKSTVILDG